MARLIWLPVAQQDFDDVCDSLAIVAPQYAGRFATAVVALAEDAAERPYFGAEIEQYGRPDIRERLFDSYRFIYRVVDAGIEVMTVIHAARLLPRRPPG
ncbi:MAG: type II toxin-antitoxin system RelE/ParE family toxin [Fimbriiglobus sp.]